MCAKIGIIAEHKPGEARIPLTPRQIRDLQTENPELKIVVAPAEQRAFKDAEFKELGIEMSSDLRDVALVMAVKEIAIKELHTGQAYLYFSHTIKGQDYNMPMLQHILDVGATLIDYELIRDAQDRRLVFFGQHAGLAGMVNTLWSYGQRQRVLGNETPFLKIKQAIEYRDLQEIKGELTRLATEISLWLQGKPALVVGITGYGNVSKGAQEILNLLPVVELSATELVEHDLEQYAGKLVKVVFTEADMFAPRNPDQSFELQDYFEHPEKYRSNFNQYLQRLNILVNCIYWDTPYPRLITLDEIREHYAADPSLVVVGDITCDIDGAIQFNTGSTLSPAPTYIFEPESGTRKLGFEGTGPLVMAVDNLPTELPRESSAAFGEALRPFIPALGLCDYTQSFDTLELPAPIKKAVIVHAGQLTPDYQYLKKYLKA